MDGFLDKMGLAYYNEKVIAFVKKRTGIPTVFISKEDYDALDEAEKMRDVLYLVDTGNNDNASVDTPTTLTDDVAVPTETTSSVQTGYTIQIPSSFDISYRNTKIASGHVPKCLKL